MEYFSFIMIMYLYDRSDDVSNLSSYLAESPGVAPGYTNLESA